MIEGYSDKRIPYLALKFIPYISSKRASMLISHFGTIEKLFNQDVEDIKGVCGIKTSKFNKMFNKRIIFEKAEKELETVIKKGYGIVTIEDDHYPQNLKSITDPPVLMYYNGKLSDTDMNSVAIVGTRKPDNEGKNLAYGISLGLCRAGVVIVSGFAKGIDSQSHTACVDSGKRTIAVFGSGIDYIYPHENKNLANKIIDTGGVMFSEFPMGTKPLRYNFPQRNRIIAGISLGVVVIQSPADSGSLITAKIGNEYGRTIFAVPGKIGDTLYKGNNTLIKNGAVLIEDATDILTELEYEFSPYRERINRIKTEEESKGGINDSKFDKFVKNIENNNEESPDIMFFNSEDTKNDENFIEMDELNENEKKIIQHLSKNEKKHKDQLCIETEIDAGTINNCISSLSLKGIIEDHPGGYISLKF